MHYIIGIDPGLAFMGWGILRLEKINNRRTILHIGNGTLATSSQMPMHQRLYELLECLKELIANYPPHSIAIEKTFLTEHKNASAFLGYARAVALCAAGYAKCSIAEYAPTQIKKSITGKGSATKEEVMEMLVRTLFPHIHHNLIHHNSAEKIYKNILHSNHSADALALALHHAYTLI